MTLPLEHHGAPSCVPPQLQVHMGIGDASVSETGKGQEVQRGSHPSLAIFSFINRDLQGFHGTCICSGGCLVSCRVDKPTNCYIHTSRALPQWVLAMRWNRNDINFQVWHVATCEMNMVEKFSNVSKYWVQDHPGGPASDTFCKQYLNYQSSKTGTLLSEKKRRPHIICRWR